MRLVTTLLSTRITLPVPVLLMTLTLGVTLCQMWPLDEPRFTSLLPHSPQPPSTILSFDILWQICQHIKTIFLAFNHNLIQSWYFFKQDLFIWAQVSCQLLGSMPHRGKENIRNFPDCTVFKLSSSEIHIPKQGSASATVVSGFFWNWNWARHCSLWRPHLTLLFDTQLNKCCSWWIF